MRNNTLNNLQTALEIACQMQTQKHWLTHRELFAMLRPDMCDKTFRRYLDALVSVGCIEDRKPYYHAPKEYKWVGFPMLAS